MKYTIYLPISRPSMLQGLADCVADLKFPIADTELVVLADTDSATFFGRVWDAFKEVERQRECLFGGFKVHVTKRGPLLESASILERRMRVIENWEMAKGLIGDTKLLFSLEDDTRCLPESFYQLMSHLDGCDYAEGVQVHRRGTSAIGAWVITDNIVQSIPWDREGWQFIDGGGFYCFACRTHLVKEANFREGGPAFGPDVCFVNDIIRRGRYAIIDWDVPTAHILESGEALIPWWGVGQITYRKNPVTGEWAC